MARPRSLWWDLLLSMAGGFVLAAVVLAPSLALAQDDPPPPSPAPTSVLVDGVCVTDAGAAMQYMATMRTGHTVVSGGFLYVTAAQAMGSFAIQLEMVPISGGPGFDQLVMPLEFPLCSGQYTYEDGAQLGGLVMLAFASVFGIKFLARALTERVNA